MDLDDPLQHSIELLQSLLEEPFRRHLDVCDDVHACDASGNSLLHWAAAFGNFSAAHALLKRGVEVDARNDRGATPLLVAAALCPNMGSIGYLLVSHGASLNERVGLDRSLTVKSLLEARQLGSVWEWLTACKNNLLPKGEDNLVRFQGCRELPVVDDRLAAILCCPTRLNQMRLHTGGLLSRTPAVLLPHPPPRQLQQPQQLPAGTLKASASPTLSTALPHDFITPLTKALHAHFELLESREMADRLQIEKEQLESFLCLYAETVALSIASCGDEYDQDEEKSGEMEPVQGFLHEAQTSEDSTAAGYTTSNDGEKSAAVGHIQAVLGERIDASGRRHLLVLYSEPYCFDGRTEAWHCAEALTSDPVVRAYLEHNYSVTTLPDTSDAKPSSLTARDIGSPLETWEREQLEAQLRLLPRRILYSREDGAPLLPQSVSTIVVSSTIQSPNREIMSPVTDFVFQHPQQPQFLGGKNENANTNGVATAGPQSNSSSSSMVADRDSLPVEKKRFPARFFPQSHRQHDGLSGDADKLKADANVPTGQLLLGGSLRRLGNTLDVLREQKKELLQKPTTMPASAKRGLYTLTTSIDTTDSNSTAPSSALTRAPATSGGSMVDSLPPKEDTSYLSASQKARYNNFLYGAALRVLARKQKS
ncbi:hypothetical protein ABL78_0080 [Leptomonas seymouri]|uniref:Uncharacterized protein n=1 Tax=Leptomonas seymouri TaxID=5684 RepID=A0A0N0P9L2_LEPSE|nr:hypothetical protein ABL78_0080 [Leptomonas seymouri]|eukprot:KPI90847.1 hypothetical protein ABL78_0080 [Leptomonas seymouri]